MCGQENFSKETDVALYIERALREMGCEKPALTRLQPVLKEVLQYMLFRDTLPADGELKVFLYLTMAFVLKVTQVTALSLWQGENFLKARMNFFPL